MHLGCDANDKAKLRFIEPFKFLTQAALTVLPAVGMIASMLE